MCIKLCFQTISIIYFKSVHTHKTPTDFGKLINFFHHLYFIPRDDYDRSRFSMFKYAFKFFINILNASTIIITRTIQKLTLHSNIFLKKFNIIVLKVKNFKSFLLRTCLLLYFRIIFVWRLCILLRISYKQIRRWNRNTINFVIFVFNAISSEFDQIVRISSRNNSTTVLIGCNLENASKRENNP